MKVNTIAPSIIPNKFTHNQKTNKNINSSQTTLVSFTAKKESENSPNIFNHGCKKLSTYINRLGSKILSFEKTNKKTIEQKKKTKIKQEAIIEDEKDKSPKPSFKTNYEDAINVLKENKKLSEEWVASNLSVLAAIYNWETIGKLSKAEIKEHTAILNHNRKNSIKHLEDARDEEYKKYIQSIWRDYIYVNTPKCPPNKERNLFGLQELVKYGSNEDLKNLPEYYHILKDEDLVREYAKFVTKVEKDYDDTYDLTVFIHPDLFSFGDETMEEVLKGIKKYYVDMDNAKGLKNSNYEELLEYIHWVKSKNPNISNNARQIMDKMVEQNPWMKDEVEELL